MFKTNKRAGITGAAAALLMAFTLIFTAAGPLPSRALSDVFDIYNSGKYYEKFTQNLRESDVLGIQFKTVCDTKKLGLEFRDNPNGRSVTFSLYKWDKNPRDSVKGEKMLECELTEWERETPAFVDFGTLPGGVLPAGEYYLEMRIHNSNTYLKMYWFKPTNGGVTCYINDYFTPGGPMGVIVSAEPCENPFGFVSNLTDFPYYSPPPEYVYPENSEVTKMAVDSTQWIYEDGLGRTNPTYKDSGNKREKKVGMFYWTWHYNFTGNRAVNVNSILEEYPEAKNDYFHKAWPTGGVAFFWNEPIYGFYTTLDDYVLRKHAELLADAGVDFVLFDCTNGDYTWEPAYMKLLKVWSEARKDGINTPQVAFMLQFGFTENTRSSLTQIYEKIYRDGLYQDLWFYWEGKPLVMAHSSGLSPEDMLDNELRNFFTFKAGNPSYFGGDSDDGTWGWLHITPQAVYKNPDGTVEMTTVGIAMNANSETMQCDSMNNPHNMGRSYSRDPKFSYTYTYRGEKIVAKTGMENSKLYGINFQEQWDFAIAQDPEIIFVTGWNEWTAGRNEVWGSTPNGFPDECDDENSRDIEPSKGDLKDHYYYQLVSNIRRFKGVSVPVSAEKTVSVDISTGEGWNSKGVVSYNHYTNNTYGHDADGYSGTHLTNDKTRNDFKTLKAAYDSENFYFYAETADDITPYTDENWMRLIIDAGPAEADSKDWEGFEFIVGRETGTSSTLVLEKSTGGWNWEKVADVAYTVSGNVLQIKIPRVALGLEGKQFSLGFKWADGNLKDGDIMTLYTDGDSAPVGRFAFSFTNIKTKKINDRGCGSFAGAGALPLMVAFMGAALLLMLKKPLSKNERRF